MLNVKRFFLIGNQAAVSWEKLTVRKFSCSAIFQTNSNEQSQTKMLTDKHGRHHSYLRISLTERCNLRCKYCMPAEGVTLQPKSQLLTNDEIFQLARLFVDEGVRKIRLTGGEPTVRRDIVDIIANLKTLPKLNCLGITTNGLMLTRQLVHMQRAGLDAINISLDTLKPERYEAITRRKGWERVIAGIDLAIQLGYKPKINCVLMRNFNDDEILDFVEFTANRNVDVRFIEYMPFTGNQWKTAGLVSFQDTMNIIKKKWPNFTALANSANDTSKAYKVPEYKGQVGFITSMTQHFCNSCNRLRLTADGNLKVCLFGNSEISLRDAIRSNCTHDDLVALIKAAVMRKKPQHAAQTTSCLNFKQVHRTNEQKETSIKFVNNQFNRINGTRIFRELPVGMFWTQTMERTSDKLQFRAYTTNKPVIDSLTHVNEEGKAQMVDVTPKEITIRKAEAMATVVVGEKITQLIHNNQLAKGDVLSVAQLAGIMGAKKTAELIPLCHNIKLTSVKVRTELNLKEACINVWSEVCCCDQTGVEMEALTAVTIAALTVYDMCKAVSHNIQIQNIQLLKKTGGKKDFQRSTCKNVHK